MPGTAGKGHVMLRRCYAGEYLLLIRVIRYFIGFTLNIVNYQIYQIFPQFHLDRFIYLFIHLDRSVLRL